MSELKASSLGTAVVTGASSGIGKVYADRLASRGYDLLLVARRAERLQELAAELTAKFGVKVEVLVADLVQPADQARLAARLASDAAITMLVNNAGVSVVGPITDAPEQNLAAMIALNVTALTLLTRAVLPRFQERKAGTVVNIGSVVGFAGYPWVPVYGGTKAYVQNFTQALQLQLAGSGVRVQLVSPSGTVSEIWEKMGDAIAGVDLPELMTTEGCVDAALLGLDRGELITAPSVHDEELLKRWQNASNELLAATQTPVVAPRYQR